MNRKLTVDEKKMRAIALRRSGCRQTAICRELNMDPRTYAKIGPEDLYTESVTEVERRHIEKVQQKEKVIAETLRLKKMGYSISAIARKLDKNPRTIKRYLEPDVTAVSKAYGSKRNGSLLSPYYEEINLAFEKGMMTNKIEQLIRERGYQGSTSLIRHYVSGIKKTRKQCNVEKEPTHTIERKHIIQLLYHSKKKATE